MEEKEGVGAWNIKNAKKAIMKALEEAWDSETMEKPYSELSNFAECIVYALEGIWLSKKLKKTGIKRRYLVSMDIENGKLQWQLIGNEAQADELPGPEPNLHLLFKFSSKFFIMLHIGYHVSIAGSIDLSFDRAKELGCTAMQIFVTNPRGWSMKELSKEEVEKFVEKKAYGIEPVAHMPYLPNLASPKKSVYDKSIKALEENIERCNMLEISYLVVHLGSTLGVEEKALDRVSNAISKCIDKYDGMLLLENEAGQRNSVGSKLEELKEIYERISSRKLGFCLDTCHAFESGYDIRDQKVVSNIEKTLGRSNIKAIHLNDAKYPLGSGKDRHQNIGLGYIGEDGFSSFFKNRWVVEKEIILETPYSKEISPKEELSLAIKLAGF